MNDKIHGWAYRLIEPGTNPTLDQVERWRYDFHGKAEKAFRAARWATIGAVCCFIGLQTHLPSSWHTVGHWVFFSAGIILGARAACCFEYGAIYRGQERMCS